MKKGKRKVASLVMKTTDDEIEKILGPPEDTDYSQMLSNDQLGGKEGQIRFKDENRIKRPNDEQFIDYSRRPLQNSKPFDSGLYISIEEILGLEMKNKGETKRNGHADELFNRQSYTSPVQPPEQSSYPQPYGNKIFTFEDTSNRQEQSIDETSQRRHIKSFHRKMIKPRQGSDSSLYIKPSYIGDSYNNTGDTNKNTSIYNNNSDRYNGDVYSNAQGHANNNGNGYVNSKNYAYMDEDPYNGHNSQDNRHYLNGKQLEKKLENSGPLYYSELKRNHSRETGTDPLLFRNPAFFQSNFNPNAYNRVKRRRRLNSSTFSCRGGVMLSPSKLSSIEYVFGNMNTDLRSPMQNMQSPNRHCIETARSLEAFKRKIDSIDFENVTVLELKNFLKDFGINPSGKKQEMIERLQRKLKELGGEVRKDIGVRGPIMGEETRETEERSPYVRLKDSLSFDGFFF